MPQGHRRRTLGSPGLWGTAPLPGPGGRAVIQRRTADGVGRCQGQLVAQFLPADHTLVEELDPFLHLGLRLDRRGERAHRHLQTSPRVERLTSKCRPVLQEGGEQGRLLDRHRLQQRVALGRGEADLHLSAGGTTVLAGDQGIAAHGVVKDLQPGPVLRQGAGADLHELEGRISWQVHAGVGAQHHRSGLAVAHGIYHPLSDADRESSPGEELLVLALAAEVVEVLVCQAQVRQVALPEGRAIGGVPAGRQPVDALIGGGDRLVAAPAAGGLGVGADRVVGHLQAGDGSAPGGPTLGVSRHRILSQRRHQK